jgi:hypothetical protein
MTMIEENPMLVLLEAMIGVKDPIERQEERGQQDFVNSAVLPHKFNFCTMEQFTEMGIVFGGKVDDLFSNATLPDGWRKEATNHSMWSKLIDDQGRERASIFYKAAFYDRDAFLNITQRYSCHVEPINGWDADTEYWHCTVTDCGNAIWISEQIGPEPDSKAPRDVCVKWYDKKDELAKVGHAWLDDHYPDWKNPLAYW